MAEIVPIIEKLIQLALKNPNREEAASAALKAVSLIDKFSIPLGSDVIITRDPGEWTPPDPSFMNTVADILNDRKTRATYDERNPVFQQGASGGDGGLRIQDREMVDPHEAWRQRMIDAWRAIRESRKRLESEIRAWEQRTRQKWDAPFW